MLLAGCVAKGDGGSNTSRLPVAQAPAGFTCPTAGSVVTYSNGVTITHRGADQNDPTICISTDDAGTETRFIYGRYRADGVNDIAIRSQLASLFPLRTGQRALINRWAYTTRGRVLEPFEDTVEVMGDEIIEVGDQKIDSWKNRVVNKGITNGFSVEYFLVR